MDSRGIAVFLNAASAGSLSAAARRLGLTAMTATRRLAALEAELGVRLIQRTTRSVSLTTEGEAFLPFAATMLEAAEAGRGVLAPSKTGAAGLLRVTAPDSLGRAVIIPLIPKLLAHNPNLRIDLLLTDIPVDIVSTGVDVAVRIATLPDSSFIATALARNPRILCASPDYLSRRGVPRRLGDLASHDCILPTGTTQWRFVAEEQDHSVRVAGRFTASNTAGVRDACLMGLGLALLSVWHVKADISAARLVDIPLDDARPEELAISALYPTNRQVLPKVRVFVKAMKHALAALASPVQPTTG
jgi:DNA-binding transcriptional LysR family regulator